MNKGMQLISKILAYIPLVLFTLIGFISLDSAEAFMYLGLGLVLYFIIGFGLTSGDKEYQIAGVLSLLILTVVFYLGESEVFGSTMTIVYIWFYYGIVYGFSIWVRHYGSKGV